MSDKQKDDWNEILKYFYRNLTKLWNQHGQSILIGDFSFGYFLQKESTSLLFNPNLVQETWNSKRCYLSPTLQRILVQKLRIKPSLTCTL